jgi:hypothetical protein
MTAFALSFPFIRIAIAIVIVALIDLHRCQFVWQRIFLFVCNVKKDLLLFVACSLSLSLSSFSDDFNDLSHFVFKSSTHADNVLPFATKSTIAQCPNEPSNSCLTFLGTRICGDLFSRESFAPGSSGRFRLDWRFFGNATLCQLQGLPNTMFHCGDLIMASPTKDNPDCQGHSIVAGTPLWLCPASANCFPVDNGGFYTAVGDSQWHTYSTIFSNYSSHIRLGAYQFGGAPRSFFIDKMELFIEVAAPPTPTPNSTPQAPPQPSTLLTTSRTSLSEANDTFATDVASELVTESDNTAISTVDGADVPLIVGLVCGGVGVILLAVVGFTIVCIRRNRLQSAEVVTATEPSSHYASTSMVARQTSNDTYDTFRNDEV